jgi:hypothetical protein
LSVKKEKYKNKGKKTWPKLLPVKSPVGSWAVNQKTLKKKKKKKKIAQPMSINKHEKNFITLKCLIIFFNISRNISLFSL